MNNTTKNDFDYVVIGSGVLGALVAYELAKAGKDVVIVEAGDWVTRWKAVEHYRNLPNKNIYAGSPYPNLPWARNPQGGGYLDQKGPVDYDTLYIRMVGGSTWHWDSVSWRLLPSDFRLNSDHGVGRDWAFSYEDIEPYYQRAEEEMGVNGYDEEDQSGQHGGQFPPRSQPYPTPGHPLSWGQKVMAAKLQAGGYDALHEPNARLSVPQDERPACAGNNSCDPICPIGAKYTGDIHVRKAMEAGATILTNSVVYRLDADNNGKIVSLTYRRPDKTDGTITGRHFIVAANGIESPKLLLMSTSEKYPDGIANSSGMVGRNLMDHTGLTFTLTTSEPVWPGTGPNSLLCMMNGRDGDFRKERSAYKTTFYNLTTHGGITAQLLKDGVMGTELFDKVREKVGRTIILGIDLETLPNPENRISPSKTKVDAIGLPVPEIYYDVNPYWDSGRSAAIEDVKNIAKVLDAEVDDLDPGKANRQHIMGSLIMGDDPKTSVVDGNLRTHDHDNLYVASTAVFPSTGCVNPTLTGAALALRLANKLLEEAAA